MVDEATDSDGHGSEEEYQELLKDLNNQGIMADGDKMANQGGPNLLSMLPQRASNAALLASIPNLDRYYDVKSKDKAHVLDLMSRTTFRSRKEIIKFLEFLDWCDEFETGLDYCLRYLVGVNSEGGKAREQYTDAITTWRFRNYGSNNRNKLQQKHQEGKLD